MSQRLKLLREKKWDLLSAILAILEEEDENDMDAMIKYSNLTASEKKAVRDFIQNISEK